MSATFDSDTILDDTLNPDDIQQHGLQDDSQTTEDSRTPENDRTHGDNRTYEDMRTPESPDDERNMLQFIKHVMGRERSAKYEMIETLHDQIVLLKEQLAHKQGIIDSLLDAHCNSTPCHHHTQQQHSNNNNSSSNNNNNNNQQQNTLPVVVNGASLPREATLLGVKTLIEEQMSRNVTHVEYLHTAHAQQPPHVKGVKNVSDILTDIRDLIESRALPPQLQQQQQQQQEQQQQQQQQQIVKGDEQKVYRIKFKAPTQTCKMRFVN